MNKKNSNLQISMLVQVILSIACLTFLVASMFEQGFTVLAQIILGLLFLVMAYNNHKIYHRKVFTVIYITVAFLLFFVCFYGIYRG